MRAFLSTRNLVYQEAPIPLLGLDSAYLTEHLQSLILTDAFPSKQTPTGAQLLFWQVRYTLLSAGGEGRHQGCTALHAATYATAADRGSEGPA